MSAELPIIIPDWPVPDFVKSISTRRTGGVSKAPFNSFNVAHHVGDNRESVIHNRAILRRDWLLPDEPHWLNQTHSTSVLELTDKTKDKNADASWTEQRDTICVVMTADCLPLLVYDAAQKRVAAIHAGWRGLANGIIEITLDAMEAVPEQTSIWLGPAIGPSAFEVGSEVRDVFIELNSESTQSFTPIDEQDKYLADIYQLARLRLNNYGIDSVYGGNCCTVSDHDRFFSYRRDGQTGRMATLIWLSE